MSVQWIKDVDSGELFPVVEDDNFDIPEHLKDADYNEVDYDKTIKYTIEQLQNQLIAAQNQINENNQDTYVNAVSEPLKELPIETVEVPKSYFEWSNILKYAAVPVVCIGLLVLSLCSLKILSDEGIIDISVSESGDSYIISPDPAFIESHSNNQSETADTTFSESDETETENNPLLNWAFRFGAVIISIFCLRLVIKFLMNTIRSV